MCYKFEAREEEEEIITILCKHKHGSIYFRLNVIFIKQLILFQCGISHSVKSIHKNFINKEVHRQVFHRQCNLSTRNLSTIVIYPQCNSSIWNPSKRNLSTIVIYPQCNLSIWNPSKRNLSTIVIYPQCTPSIENSLTENPSTGNSSTVEGLHCRWITLWIDYNCG